MQDPTFLPADLPVPHDDGACAHLTGMRLPDVTLPATSGGPVHLSSLPGRVVLYLYPRTAQPGETLNDWDIIPGARGCTPQACAFRDHHAELLALNAQVYGVSTQETAVQQEAVTRLHLPFPLLSDADLTLARALHLPTFTYGGDVLLRRATLIAEEGIIQHVMYPVFPPDRNATDVLDWLKRHPMRVRAR